MQKEQKVTALLLLFAAFLLALAPGQLARAQQATISGTVVAQNSGETLPGVSVFVEEFRASGVAAVTDSGGAYTLTIPAERVDGRTATVSASFVGYKTGQKQITLSPGQKQVNFALSRDVLQMEQVVVTGTVGETSLKEVPFAVSQVQSEAIEKAAPAGSPAEAIQSRVPGAKVVSGIGTPGEKASITLRGFNRIPQGGKGGQEPLYIVDGARMGGTVDLSALNVKNIEVVKGAAAASVYGSQAANGVIRITTKSGEGLNPNDTRITVRNEIGFNQLNSPNQHGRYHDRMVARTSFVGAGGDQIEPGDWIRVDGEGDVHKATYETASEDNSFNGVSFHDNRYPEFNDHLESIFNESLFYRNNAAVSRRMEDTNFRLSFGNVQNNGVVRFSNGYGKQNFRANIEHDVVPELTIGVNGFVSRSERDDPTSMSGSTSIWPAPYFISPTVSLSSKDEEGEYEVQPDETTRYENPLYVVNNTQYSQTRLRAVGTFRTEYRPFPWLNVEGMFNYKTFNGRTREFKDKGYETSQNAAINEGFYSISTGKTRSWDASLNATFIKAFGPLDTRTQVKALAQKRRYASDYTNGNGLAVRGVQTINNIPAENRNAGSFQTDTRDLFGFAQTQIDYQGRYIANLLVRRDGSSQFGEEERWNTYWRASGAWLPSRESWWPLENSLNFLKLRYSAATAGTQPNFGAKFQTFNVGQARISKGLLGNPQLNPEKSLEQSLGVEFALFERVSGKFTYTTTTTENQILRVPLPAYFGFNSQWRNAGTVESFAIEGQMDISVIEGENLSLSVGGNFGRSVATIVDFNRPPFRVGQDDIFRIEEGVQLGTFFGNRYIRDMSALPEQWQSHRDAFAVNDEGWVVAVGEGNSWRDGIREQLWGTQVDVDGDGDGDFDWGEPIKFQSEDGSDVPIGNSVPSFTYGFNTNFSWHGFNAYMLWGGQYGGDVYNFNRHWSGNNHNATDQAGKSAETKKPERYLNEFGAFNNRYVEDGTYLKLRALSVGYTFDNEMIGRFLGDSASRFLQSAEFSVVGRNLLTFTGYSGYDPEVGNSRGGVSSSGLLRIDYFTHPNYRTFTGKVRLTF